jgi:hypothetical protein
VPPRRLPKPELRRPATKPAPARKIGLDGLRTLARRYAETNVVRAIGAAFAVVAVVVLAGLAWLWLFRG